MNVRKKNFPDSASLAECQEFVTENERHGVECPCCHQLVKVYLYRVRKKDLTFLARLEHAYNRYRRPVHIREFMSFSGNVKATWDTMHLRLMTLIRSPKKGYYEPTPELKKFLHDGMYVPAYILVRDGMVISNSGMEEDYEDRWVKARDVMGGPFKLEDVWNIPETKKAG